ncbi:hypothetical protein [Sorangium sp. So ce1151]|uniref:hypothetical protein n=1 Tax=Sorangium sp. So ce1151 TaxID=3133332 RepID=UPI003F62114A
MEFHPFRIAALALAAGLFLTGLSGCKKGDDTASEQGRGQDKRAMSFPVEVLATPGGMPARSGGPAADPGLPGANPSATPSNEASGQAVVDLYRVSGGKIAERWNGVQNVPAMTASGNSMFSDLCVYRQPKQEVTEAQEPKNEKMVTAAYNGQACTDIATLDRWIDDVLGRRLPPKCSPDG